MARASVVVLAVLVLSISPGCDSGTGTTPSTPLTPTTPAATPPPGQAPTPQAELKTGPITFDGVGGEGAPFASSSESGFTIEATAGSWHAGANYGNPRPFIRFEAQGGRTVTGELQVTGGGATFSFTSVDLYSSTTPIPYQITGLRSSGTVFAASGTLGNTFGQFRTVASPAPDAVIDTLKIVLINAAAPCCRNPMGVDNIVLVK